MNELALFAGAGGGILGGKLLGWRTVCAVEREAYAAAVLAQRQNDGLLDIFPIWSDVETFDGKPWRGIVDVVSGGFPCQDISIAGPGGGIEGERSGLWMEMARIIGEVQPRFAFVENSPVLTSRGLGAVLGDLAALGYDAEWGVLGAADVGAPHQRDRIWILAHALCGGWDEGRSGRPICKNTQRGEAESANPTSKRLEKRSGLLRREAGAYSAVEALTAWAVEPRLDRVAHGVADRVDRIKAIGNGQVPLCAAEAFTRLLARIDI